MFPIESFLNTSMAAFPFPSNRLTSYIVLLRTLHATVKSANGKYSETVFTTVCGVNLINCIYAF